MVEEKQITNTKDKISSLYEEVGKKVVWQKNMIRDLLIWVLSGGHVLIEWAPGLAKTLSVDTLSKTLELEFNRIQFTPDLLPSDLLGSNIYNPQTKDFYVRKWPIFTNFILADEINRAPSKVQSALLEAMAEKQVSIWDNTFKLDKPFMVLATQNPIEQEWTFNLPEAQLDRFLLKTVVDFPSAQEEIDIMKSSKDQEKVEIKNIFTKEEILNLQEKSTEIYADDAILEYIKDIVFYTRNNNSKISKYLSFWVSPRASLALLKASKSLALLEGRDFVIPEDVKEMAYPVLRHRISLSYEALAEDVLVDDLIKTILDNVLIK